MNQNNIKFFVFILLILILLLLLNKKEELFGRRRRRRRRRERRAARRAAEAGTAAAIASGVIETDATPTDVKEAEVFRIRKIAEIVGVTIDIDDEDIEEDGGSVRMKDDVLDKKGIPTLKSKLKTLFDDTDINIDKDKYLKEVKIKDVEFEKQKADDKKINNLTTTVGDIDKLLKTLPRQFSNDLDTKLNPTFTTLSSDIQYLKNTQGNLTGYGSEIEASVNFINS